MDALNEIHLRSFNDNVLPDGCAQLIIADPPYFEVRGEFDFAWESMRIKRQLREVVEKLRAGDVLPAGSLNRFKEKFER